ncbi:MAG: SGNH/GDSL hydrolase family protein [Tepidiformaceae bacterium]
MRILRLSTSDDVLPTVAEHERGYRLVEAALARECGQPVETIVRNIWLTDQLPDLIDRWLDADQPDIVTFKVSSYWFSYESVPLRFERSRLGVPGKMLAGLGATAGETSWLAHTPAFHAARNTIRRAIGGGAVYFTPDQVIERVTACLRRILQRENVVLIVRGPLVSEAGGTSPATQRRYEEQRRYVDRAVADRCAALHVYYTGCRAAPPASELLIYRGPDRLHMNPLGHELMGREEAAAAVAAWRISMGADAPLYRESTAVV